MSRIAYVNGRYCPHRAASVHVEDRGFQFADGVYEVIGVRHGRLVDGTGHFDRLDRSLDALSIPRPMGRGALLAVIGETVRRNGVVDGIVYFQATRGVARRDHPFPKAPTPSFVVTSRRGIGPAPAALAEGVAVHAVPDKRWGRCDIKSVGLLPNVIAKQAAREAGAYEAWLVGEGDLVTEGGSTNAWIVDRDGRLRTHPATNAILNGITRQRVIALARAAGLSVEERPFTLAEAFGAREAFLTSTTSYVLPIVRINDRPIGNGHPGETASRLHDVYARFAAEQGEALS
ncbi:MAG: D-amino-acid transaminase [Alphaproteobacteria bacterium]|nr:D-amino-acid transaminase [Alphaproteobacteria bacterium]